MFIHIPKSGGSSVEQSSLFQDKTRRPAGHYHVKRYLEQEGVTSFKSFAIFERFLSAFYYMANGGRNHEDAVWSEKNIGNATIDEWVLDIGIKDDYFHFESMWPYVFLDDTVTPAPDTNTIGVECRLCFLPGGLLIHHRLGKFQLWKHFPRSASL